MHESETLRQIAQLRQRVTTLERLIQEDMTLNSSQITAMTEYASKQFGLSLFDLLGNCRKANHVSARTAVVYAARRLGFSLQAIGRKLGKDHSSIIYLLHHYDHRLATFPEHREAMMAVVNKFKP